MKLSLYMLGLSIALLASEVAIVKRYVYSEVAYSNEKDERVVQVGDGCSGFIVGKELVMTAGHCIHPYEDKNSIKIHTTDGKIHEGKLICMGSIYKHEPDFAVISTESLSSYKHFLIRLTPPAFMENFYHTGYEADIDGQRKWPALYLADELNRHIFASHVFYGNSGSAIYDKDGRVVGITSQIHLDNTYFFPALIATSISATFPCLKEYLKK